MISSFFTFWIKNLRVSFLVIFLLIFAGLFSLYTIPKESSPDIKYGIIQISTIYPGVNPVDIDSIITDKIEKEVKDVDGIKKFTSTSSVGISSVVLELETDADTRDVLTDIKDKVDKIAFPDDVEDPLVFEMSSTNTLVFELLLYGDETKFDSFMLQQKAQLLKSKLEGKNGVSTIDLAGADLQGTGGGGGSGDYEIKVLLDKDKVELLGLSLKSIASTIKSYNKNTSIGNYQVGDLKYDFRFFGELKDLEELKNVIIIDSGISQVRLKDVAIFKNEYSDDSIKKLGEYNNYGYNYTSLTFNKSTGSNIFEVSKNVKISVTELMETKDFEGLTVKYSKDMSDLIIKDYENLSNTGITTLVLVFLTILIFVGFRESIVATLLLPLAFLITFIVLDTLGMSLNFLTNFSLVLSLGIAIDTVIVIIEGASEKTKLGYHRVSAIMLAIRDFKSPLISGTLTTLSAFLPMIFLPGVIGKYLAFIPITVFTTLLAALVLSLTLSSSLFVKIIATNKFFHRDEKLEENLSEEDKEILRVDRKGKTEKKEHGLNLRESTLEKIGNFYYNRLLSILHSKITSLLLVVVPVILMALTFVFLAPKIGFVMFPSTDEGVLEIKVTSRSGTDKEYFLPYIKQIDESVSKFEELNVYYTTVTDNSLYVYVDLLEAKDRQAEGLMNVFDVEKIIVEDLKSLQSSGFEVNAAIMANGPPTGDPVGIKLVADSTRNFDILKLVSDDFKKYLKTIEGTKGVNSSSDDTPGQFIFQFDNDKLSNIGLTPNDVLGELYFYTNGLKAGSIRSDYEDNDIVLSFEQFENTLNPKDISDLVINTKVGDIRVGDFSSYEFVKSVSSIFRDNGKITISVGAKLENGVLPTEVQPALEKFALEYNYPEGISFSSGGEQSENSELILSTIKSLFISLFLIFSILVFQFNSFRQPAIVLYSVILALLGVNLGLYLTGNPYSMPFGIGFIALTGIVVNDAIILIDKINNALDKKGVRDTKELNREEQIEKVVVAAKSRLQPVIVTTLTTVFGVLPLAMQDEFWAGLGYTIVFGLIVGSAMTLFVIPILYKSLVLVDKKSGPGLFKKIFLKKKTRKLKS